MSLGFKRLRKPTAEVGTLARRLYRMLLTQLLRIFERVLAKVRKSFVPELSFVFATVTQKVQGAIGYLATVHYRNS